MRFSSFGCWLLVAGCWLLVAGLGLLITACGAHDPGHSQHQQGSVIFEGTAEESNELSSQQTRASKTTCTIRVDYPHAAWWGQGFNMTRIVKAKAEGKCTTEPPWPGLKYHLYMVLERAKPSIGFVPRWVEIGREGPLTRIAQTIGAQQSAAWSVSSTYIFAPCSDARYRVWVYVLREAPGLVAATPITFGPIENFVKCFPDEPPPSPPYYPPR
ncbi:MAG: hypothetical protein KatS3mg072_1445 [Meiothermus sp.]|nr:MAG: hypothetical protein KatS3mg072_1445 [Meiothermus sp.]